MFTPAEAALERGWPGRIDGERVVQLAAQTLQAFFSGGASAREHAEYPLADVELRPPVLAPPGIRVFAPFGELDFAFGNSAAIGGPDAQVAVPTGSRELRPGVGLAAMVGAEGAIGGFTLANLWRAGDLPGAKSADFATSIGPVVVTPDDLPGDRGAIAVRVNGEARGRADLGGLARPWAELVAHAARNTTLRPGELLIAAAPPTDGPALRPGDVVELELEGVGVLRNRVAGG
jgi:2-keto-4-pentenoate hydratase/2-oxohepta-3-ene-1,7-dioic acid hydratase in catechol pathway